MIDLGAVFVQSNDDLQVTCLTGRTMISNTTFVLKLPVCYSNSISMTEWSPALTWSALSPALLRESLTWGQMVLFVAGVKFCENIVFGIKFIVLAKRDFAINCNSSDHSSWHSRVYANYHHKKWGSRLWKPILLPMAVYICMVTHGLGLVHTYTKCYIR